MGGLGGAGGVHPVAVKSVFTTYLLKTEDHHSPSPRLKVIARSTSRSATFAAGGHVTGLRRPPSVEQSHFESRTFSQNGQSGKINVWSEAVFGLVCLVPLDVSQPGQMLPEPLKPFTEAAACKLQVSLDLLRWNIPSVICTHAHCSNGCNIYFLYTSISSSHIKT